MTNPAPTGLDPQEVRRADQIAQADAEAKEKEDGTYVRAPRKGEGGVSFDYGDVDPRSTYAGGDTEELARARKIAEDDAEARLEADGALVRKPKEGEGGVSFDYGTPPKDGYEGQS